MREIQVIYDVSLNTGFLNNSVSAMGSGRYLLRHFGEKIWWLVFHYVRHASIVFSGLKRFNRGKLNFNDVLGVSILF